MRASRCRDVLRSGRGRWPGGGVANSASLRPSEDPAASAAFDLLLDQVDRIEQAVGVAGTGNVDVDRDDRVDALDDA